MLLEEGNTLSSTMRQRRNYVQYLWNKRKKYFFPNDYAYYIEESL